MGKPSERLSVLTRGETQWIAWSVDSRLVELHVQATGMPGEIDSVFLGRINRIDRNLDAAFVELGAGKSGLLPLDDTRQKPAEGSKVVVRVKREAYGDKSARLTRQLGIAGSCLVLTPGRRGVAVSDRIADKSIRRRLAKLVEDTGRPGEGFIVRAAAANAKDHELLSEIGLLRVQGERLAELSRSGNAPALLLPGASALQRIVRDSGARFSEVVVDSRNEAERLRTWCEDHVPRCSEKIAYRHSRDWDVPIEALFVQAEEALEPHVDLPSGGRLLVESGKTLTAIDVDTGKHRSFAGDAGAAQTFLKSNLEAASEIGRQLRLRAIAGIVVIDFVNMKDPGHRRRVVDRLKAEVTEDPARCWVGEMSRLGLVEMTRRRQGPSLAEVLSVECTQCDGTGRTMRDVRSILRGGD
jgi:Rne/Rng family ribonuclease